MRLGATYQVVFVNKHELKVSRFLVRETTQRHQKFSEESWELWSPALQGSCQMTANHQRRQGHDQWGWPCRIIHKKNMRLGASLQAVFASKYALNCPGSFSRERTQGPQRSSEESRKWSSKSKRTACKPGFLVWTQCNPIEHDFYVIILFLTFCCHYWLRSRKDTSATNLMSAGW